MDKIERKVVLDNLLLDNRGRVSWYKNIGNIITIIYDSETYMFKIVGYNNKKDIVYIEYNNKKHPIQRSNLSKGAIGNIIGKYSKDYKYSVGEVVNGNKILECTRTKDIDGNNRKSYLVECTKDGFKRIILEYSLNSGCTCPICTNKKVVKGINDLWTTHTNIAKLLLCADDGYKYTSGSGKHLLWKCPNCDNIIDARIPDVIYSNGELRCNKCSDGFSYPEKLMSNILDSLGIEYKYHVKIKDKYFIFKDKKYKPEYDFQINYNNKNVLIEMDGNFHNRPHGHSSMTIQDIEYIDFQKDKLAIDNGYEIIRIDCRISDYDYIIKSILSTDLKNIVDTSKLDKIALNTLSYKSKMLEACQLYNNGFKIIEISSKIKTNTRSVREYIKKGTELGWCTYQAYRDCLGNGSKKVVCLNTKEIFDSITQASKEKNIYESNISACCRHKILSCSPKNTKNQDLIWMYYEEYEKLLKNNTDINEYIKTKIAEKYKRCTKVICLNNEKVFNSMSEAYKWMGYSPDGRSIKDNCNGKLKFAGIHPKTGERLRWMYYEDYDKNYS